MSTKLLITSTILLTVLVGCSGQSFRKKIDNEEYDSIKDESFSRFNSTRIDTYDKKSLNDIAKATAACHEEKFYKGKSILEEKMQQEKSNPYYWTALGTCYYLEGEISKSLFYYDLASESLKNYKEADKNIAEANIENNLGLIHLKNKRYNEAYDSFKKAANLVPNFYTPKINMAQIYLEFNQDERAIDVLASIESKVHGDIDVLYSLALAYFRTGQHEKSFSTMIKIDRNYLNRADIVGLWAMNLMKKNRFVDAKTILEKRIVATEFESRNKKILETIETSIKELEKKKTN
jgi:tetratricopeptide (TPR) repeat protein